MLMIKKFCDGYRFIKDFMVFMTTRDFIAWFITAILLPFAVPYCFAYFALYLWNLQENSHVSLAFIQVSEKLIYDNGVYLFFATDLLLSLSYINVKKLLPRWHKKNKYPFRFSMLSEAQSVVVKEFPTYDVKSRLWYPLIAIITGTASLFTCAFLNVYIHEQYIAFLDKISSFLTKVLCKVGILDNLPSLAYMLMMLNVFLMVSTCIMAFDIMYRRYRRTRDFVM